MEEEVVEEYEWGMGGLADTPLLVLTASSLFLLDLRLLLLLLLTHRLRESNSVSLSGEGWLEAAAPASLLLLGVHGAERTDEVKDEAGDNWEEILNMFAVAWKVARDGAEDEAASAKGKALTATDVVHELVMVCEFSLSHVTPEPLM